MSDELTAYEKVGEQYGLRLRLVMVAAAMSVYWFSYVYAEFSLALADRVYVLEKGAVRFTGSAAALRSDRSVLDQLLTL